MNNYISQIYNYIPGKVDEMRNENVINNGIIIPPEPRNEKYKCQYCSKEYKHNHDLKIHLQKHDEKDWKYQWENWSNKYYRKQSYNYHIRVWKTKIQGKQIFVEFCTIQLK